MSTLDALRFAVLQVANGAGLGQDITRELFDLTEIPTRRAERRAEVWQKGFVRSLSADDVIVLNLYGLIPEAVVTGCPHTKRNCLLLDEVKKRWGAALDEKPNMVLAQTIYSLYQTNPAHQVFERLNRYCGLSKAIHMAQHAYDIQSALETTNNWIMHNLRARPFYTPAQRELFRQKHCDICPVPFVPKPLGYVF
jgi:hypothetical protein